MNYTSENTGLLAANSIAIRNKMRGQYGDFNTAWTCTYFGAGFATIQDAHGKSWDINTRNSAIIEA